MEFGNIDTNSCLPSPLVILCLWSPSWPSIVDIQPQDPRPPPQNLPPRFVDLGFDSDSDSEVLYVLKSMQVDPENVVVLP